MNAARWKLIIYLAAIFAAGAASGWMVAVKATREEALRNFRHEEVAHKMKQCMHGELQLTDEQRRKIDDIIDDTADQMKSYQGQHMKRVAGIVSNRNEKIMAVLNPDQQRQFQESEERRQQQLREKMRARGGSRDRDRNKDSGDMRPRERHRGGDRCETNVSTKNHNNQEPQGE